MSRTKPTILSLYDRSGVWSAPYLQAGCRVIQVDLEFGIDVRTIKCGLENIYGIIAAPPCTDLCLSGARWWKQKGNKALFDSLALCDCVLRYVWLYNPVFWCLENPIGRLSKYYGPPKMTFNPCAFGDPWTKKTCLWGKFKKPKIKLTDPILGSKIRNMKRGFERSITPSGFALAFFKTNPPRFQR